MPTLTSTWQSFNVVYGAPYVPTFLIKNNGLLSTLIILLTFSLIIKECHPFIYQGRFIFWSTPNNLKITFAIDTVPPSIPSTATSVLGSKIGMMTSETELMSKEGKIVSEISTDAVESTTYTCLGAGSSDPGQSSSTKNFTSDNTRFTTTAPYSVSSVLNLSSSSSTEDEDYDDYETDGDDDNVAKEATDISISSANDIREYMKSSDINLNYNVTKVTVESTTVSEGKKMSTITVLPTNTTNFSGNRAVVVDKDKASVNSSLDDRMNSFSRYSNFKVDTTSPDPTVLSPSPSRRYRFTLRGPLRSTHTSKGTAINKYENSNYEINETISRMNNINYQWFNYSVGRSDYSLSPIAFTSVSYVTYPTKNFLQKIKEKSLWLFKKINETLVPPKETFSKLKMFSLVPRVGLNLPRYWNISRGSTYGAKSTTDLERGITNITTGLSVTPPVETTTSHEKRRWENIKLTIFFIAVSENDSRRTTRSNVKRNKKRTTSTKKGWTEFSGTLSTVASSYGNDKNWSHPSNVNMSYLKNNTFRSTISPSFFGNSTLISSISVNADNSRESMTAVFTNNSEATTVLTGSCNDTNITSCNNYTYNNMSNVANNPNNVNNGTVLNAAGRFVTNCLGHMSKMMHCFSSGDPPEVTMDNITFYLFTRQNNETGEILTVDNIRYDEIRTPPRTPDEDDEDEEDGSDNYEYYSEDVYPEFAANGRIILSRKKKNTAAVANLRRITEFRLSPLLNRNKRMRKDANYYCDKVDDKDADEDDDESNSGKNNYEEKRENGGKDVLFCSLNNRKDKNKCDKIRNKNKDVNYDDDDNCENEFKGLKFGKSIITSKHFNINDRTKIIIHGYTQSYTSEAIIQLKDAYLNKGSYNTILVDWSQLAKGPCYNLASRYAKSVGGLVKELIYRLAVGGISMKSVHLIGFSLGAQVAGFAGSNFNTGHIYRITGLDPAMPLFAKKDPENILDAGDAHFVDIIHTSHILGQGLPLGHADFYPNGGVTQPGCDKSDIICSHVRGLLLFIESVKSTVSFPSVSCESWEMFVAGRCNQTPGALMGEPCTARANGLYYLKTGSTAPFALEK